MRIRSAIGLGWTCVSLVTACNDQPTDVSSGRVSTAVATGTVTILPGARIQDSVNKYASGTSFLLKAGVHRLQSITPKSSMSFSGEPGTVLSGAVLLTTFT